MVLIDTPGFNNPDNKQTDEKIFKKICNTINEIAFTPDEDGQ